MGAQTLSVIDRWHPVKHDYGLIRAPLEQIIRELTDWHASIKIHYTQRREIKTSLANALCWYVEDGQRRSKAILRKDWSILSEPRHEAGKVLVYKTASWLVRCRPPVGQLFEWENPALRAIEPAYLGSQR